MKLELEIKNGYVRPLRPSQLKEIKNGVYVAEVKNIDTRTYIQNRSIHKYFGLLADELNKRNLSVTTVLKPDTTWNTLTVKEQIWRPIQKAVTNKDSTTKLSKSQISEVYDVLNKALGERFGLHVPFPSMED